MQAFGGTVSGTLFVARITAAISAERRRPRSRVPSASWLRTLGRYSYGLYVFHLAIDEIARRGVLAWGRWVLELEPRWTAKRAAG